MAEHERIKKDIKGDKDQRHSIKRQESQPILDRSLTWDNNPFLLTETHIHPSVDEHAEILSRLPFSAQHHELIMHLQKTYGNQYVQRLVESVRAQTKLTVSTSNDVYEQEADRFTQAIARDTTSQVQRQEEEVMPELATELQRQAEEEEEPIQMKASSLQLNNSVRAYLEPNYGNDFSDVKTHADSEAIRLSRQPILTHVIQQEGAPAIQRRETMSTEVPALTETTVSDVKSKLAGDKQEAVDSILAEIQSSKMPLLSKCKPQTILYDSSISGEGVTRWYAPSPDVKSVADMEVEVLMGDEAFSSVPWLYSSMLHEYKHVKQLIELGPWRSLMRKGDEGRSLREFHAYSWEILNAKKTGVYQDKEKMKSLGNELLRQGWNEFGKLQKVLQGIKYWRCIRTLRGAIGDNTWEPST